MVQKESDLFHFVTKKEFDDELKDVQHSLKLLDAHVVKSNLLQDITNSTLNEIKNLIDGEGVHSVKNRLDNLEKREATRRNYEKFIIILLTVAFSFDPFTKFITKILKIYYG
jgi:hypothetical protein